MQELYIDELINREIIKDCILRYFHGIDRCDKKVISSVFWSDAIVDYGLFKGSCLDFIDNVIPHLEAMTRTQHIAGNILIRIDKNAALTETYLHAYHQISAVDSNSLEDIIMGGRYFDHLEKRNGEWRITNRLLIYDWLEVKASQGDWSVGALGLNNKTASIGSRGAQDRSSEISAALLSRLPFMPQNK